MSAVPSLAELEQRLADARTHAPGSPTELAALIALAARLVRDPHRRGTLAREGAALAARLGDEARRLHCRAMAAEAAARRENPADALPKALEVLAEAERLGDAQALAQAHHAVGHCFDVLDCIPEALEHCHQSLAYYRHALDSFGEGRMLSFMAHLFRILGEDGRGRELYEQAHDIFLAHDDPSGAGTMLANIAAIQRAGGDPHGAAATCERALARFEEADMPLDAVQAMREYARVLADLGQHEAADLWAKRAQERNRLPDGSPADPGYEIDILLTRAGAAQLPLGDMDGAHLTLRRAVELSDTIGAIRHAASAESMLADALHASGDIADAYEHLRRSRQLTEEIARASHDRRVHALRVRFEVEQAQREALLYRQQAHEQAQIIAELERTKAELAARMADLQRLHAEVTELSRTDPLTGLTNRRFMGERLDELSRATVRYGTPLSLALFDVDTFKGINDRYGHETGDAVLVALAELMRRHLRRSDLPARLGGDEFVIIMPCTQLDEAVESCRRLQAMVHDHPWHEIASGLAVTITVGVAEASAQVSPDELLRQADTALYRGKQAGRDTVAV